MACFVTPVVVAIAVTSVLKKSAPKYHLGWLNTMLWGGAIMLAVEHIIHGEVILRPPFLTAMKNPADIPLMLWEMATVGGAMTVAIVIVWATMVMIMRKVEKVCKSKVQIIVS